MTKTEQAELKYDIELKVLRHNIRHLISLIQQIPVKPISRTLWLITTGYIIMSAWFTAFIVMSAIDYFKPAPRKHRRQS